MTRRRIHGHTNPQSPTYNSWNNMRQRCTNPEHPRHAEWGGRGITVCERWQSFENFLADMGERPEGMTLGRRNNDGPYDKNNCRWETAEQQANNKSNTRTFTRGDVTMNIEWWSKELGVSVRALYYRLNNYGTIFI